MDTLGTLWIEELNPPKGRGSIDFKGVMSRAPVVVAGYGGWEKIARPRRKALTVWKGREPVSIEIGFILDAELYDMTGVEVERSCRDLERIAGVGADEPSLCRLSSIPGPLMPHGHHRSPHVRWFIEALSWESDSIIYNNAGNRTRSAGSITMTQYVEDVRLSVIQKRKESKKGSGSKGAKRKTYTVRPGDTLQKIAARKDVYGDSKEWKRIAKANKIRDPKRLKVGTVLKIP